MKDPIAEAARWFKQAQYDLEAARYNAEGQFYAIACFSAQQSAEKALKAFLFRQGERFVTGHSVTELCERCGEHLEVFVSLTSQVSKLDRFYIPTRYPNGLPGGVPAEVYDKQDAEGAIALATEVLELVERYLGAQ
ncbi:MAG TPA: HEPN domain-containing protein [Anaerolineae bacterium]|nr:HEPN domain-containing protein [Anaerolineae bacterium]